MIYVSNKTLNLRTDARRSSDEKFHDRKGDNNELASAIDIRFSTDAIRECILLAAL